MLDEYGHRIKFYTAEVRGYFRKCRDWTQAALILFFLVLPWIQIKGHQAVLVDLPGRRFAFFGLTFWAHDAPMVFFILAIAVLSLALVTAIWGRVWCGWACPQTVFIDGVFRKIEFWIEGNHLQRRAADREPLRFSVALRKVLKWVIFAGCSSLIAHSFVAYFVGADALILMIQNPPTENLWLFTFVCVVTAILTFNFGWFREQFCIIMCPYGRFQSVLMDKKSVTVMYDQKRGEPRKGVQSGDGDCISCGRCVAVCPTGIDIRNGIQMECIACTACIDACDEIMEKVGKPKGLIRYMSLLGEKAKIRRPRVLMYGSLLFFISAIFLFLIVRRQDLHVQILRAPETPFQVLSAGSVLNHFRLHIVNQTFEDIVVDLTTPVDWDQEMIQLKMPEQNLKVGPGQFRMVHFFVVFPKSALGPSGELKTELNFNRVVAPLTLVGPSL